MNNINTHSGISYSFIKTERFKTTLISVGFYTPLNDKAAANSLACSLMKSGTEKLSDTYSFNRKLAHLYGAGVASRTAKLGDMQELRVGITVNDDCYSLSDESVVDEAGELLCDMIFGRFFSHTNYPEEAVNREKRLLCEKILGKFNDKRVYSRNRCEEIMCENEPYGLSPDGTTDEINALNNSDIAEALNRLIRKSFISVLVIGAKEPLEFTKRFSNFIDSANREFEKLPRDIIRSAEHLKTVEETLPVNQGKLVLGLRSQKGGSDRETAAEFVMTDVFGGGPYSKLFCNVREKLSLCYYCSARGVRRKGLMFVESGVEDKNIDAAKQAILSQLADIVSGNFTEKDLSSSKLSLCDMMHSIESDQPSLAQWYAARALEENPASPHEIAEIINQISAEDVKKAAENFKLDTIFILRPEEALKEGEQ